MLGALMMLSTLAEPLDVRIEGNSLVTGLHVAMLDPTGAVVAPADVKYALLEIGCSDRDTLDDKLDQDYRDAFLLSFEPLMDKYAVLASRGTRRMAKGADRAVPVGHHHTRGVVLPIAVSAHGREANITVHRWAGCSSLSELNKAASHTRLCQDGEVERRRVPTITLERASRLVPAHLPIRYLKIDAQGTDIQLLMSVPPALLRSRVQALEFETIGPKCDPIYVGQPPCDVATRYLQSIGYRVKRGTNDACSEMASKGNPYVNKQSRFGWGCEATMQFELNVNLPDGSLASINSNTNALVVSEKARLERRAQKRKTDAAAQSARR